MRLVKYAVLSFTGLALSAQAGLIFTIEAPGVQATTVPGVVTEDFNSLPLGAFSGPTAVGSLSAGGTVTAANVFGGANGSQFFQNGLSPVTLTLNSAQNYLGLWWSAGDPANILEFFDGASSLGVYNVGSITPLLSAAYFGNPIDGGGSNIREPYAYLNFTTTGGSHITSVKFTSWNFELDNISITDAQITPPGNAIPDTGSTLGFLSASLAAVTMLKRKSRS